MGVGSSDLFGQICLDRRQLGFKLVAERHELVRFGDARMIVVLTKRGDSHTVSRYIDEAFPHEPVVNGWKKHELKPFFESDARIEL